MDFKAIFIDYFKKCVSEDRAINIHEMQAIAKGNENIANQSFRELCEEGIITGKLSLTEFEPGIKLENFEKISLTPKGIDYIKREIENENSIDPFSKINSAFSTYQKNINNISKNFYNISSAKQLRELKDNLPQISNVPLDMRNSFTIEQLEQINKTYSSIARQVENLYGNSHVKSLQNYLNTIECNKKSLSELMKQPPNTLYQEITAQPLEEKTYTFKGILGQNCGDVEKYIDSSKQLQVQEDVVSRGIKVLRGYAKASVLYKASKTEYDYQRQIYDVHVDSIKNFLLQMKDSAKYLPEVTLVARKNYNLTKFELSKSLSAKVKGQISNLNYFVLTVEGKNLYRIDGNHRIEAAYQVFNETSKDILIPFSIILWNQNDYLDKDTAELAKIEEEQKENEAFLFYFLNSKAKKLDLEENIKGIICADSNRWRDADLNIANKNLSLMRQFKNQLNTQLYLNSELCKENSLKQIAEILELINDKSIDLEKFNKILKLTNILLNKDPSIELKKMKLYCKLVFYVAYKHLNEENSLRILHNLENWVKKYNFDNTTFENPILLYKNAEKTNNLAPINIFVAMAYEPNLIDSVTEWINIAIKNIEEMKPHYKGRINLHPIMKHRGYNIDLMDDIMRKIEDCSIFIAEISPCQRKNGDKDIFCDANPNVMYELGIAHHLKKPIILMRENSNFPNVPSDIQEKYRNTYDRDNSKAAREIIENAIMAILEDYYE